MVAARNKVVVGKTAKKAGSSSVIEQPSMSVLEKLQRISRLGPPRIERRRTLRGCYRSQAWLQPSDTTGALRPPVIHTRDLDPHGAGFISKHDLSVLADAELYLPAANGRPVRIACRVRRSREFDGGWFEGMVEFITEQPMFTPRRG